MNELMSFLDDHHIPYKEGGSHQHVRFGWLGLQCPWCQTQKWHLGVRLSDGYTTCWRCGHHRIGDVLMELTGGTWKDIKHLTEFDGIRRLPVAVKGKLKLPEIGPLLPAHKKYIRSRGFDPEYLSMSWGISGIGLAERLSWRLFIPIHIGRDLVSWTTRAIAKDTGPRYLSAGPTDEAVPHKNVLYGAQHVPGHAIIVVEGPADAWAIGHGAVAVLGLQVSPQQILDIAAYPRRMICFDSSDAAQKRAEALCQRLSQKSSADCITESCCLSTGDDPADADPDEIQQLKQHCGVH